jgi:Domain of unknown function (DUF4232)
MPDQGLDPQQARRLLHDAADGYHTPPDGFQRIQQGYRRRRQGRRVVAVAAAVVVLGGAGIAAAELASGGKGSPNGSRVIIPATVGSTTQAATATTIAGTTSPTPATTPTGPPVSVAPVGSPSTVGAGSGVTPTTVVQLSGCATSSLTVTVQPGNAAAGTFYQQVVFRNSGAGSCTLGGYPGVSFVDQSGKLLGQPAQRTDIAGEPVKTIVLAPGQSGSATVGLPDTGNFPPSDCNATTAVSMRVYPPNRLDSVVVPDAQKVCTTSQGRTMVGPVQFGTASP